MANASPLDPNASNNPNSVSVVTRGDRDNVEARAVEEREERRRKEKRALALFNLIEREEELEKIRRRAELAEHILRQRRKIEKRAVVIEQHRSEQENGVLESRKTFLKARLKKLVSIHSPAIHVREPKCESAKGSNLPAQTGNVTGNALVRNSVGLPELPQAPGSRLAPPELKGREDGEVTSNSQTQKRPSRRFSRASVSVEAGIKVPETSPGKARASFSVDPGTSLARRRSSFRGANFPEHRQSKDSENMFMVREESIYAGKIVLPTGPIIEQVATKPPLFKGKYYFEQANDVAMIREELNKPTVPLAQRYHVSRSVMHMTAHAAELGRKKKHEEENQDFKEEHRHRQRHPQRVKFHWHSRYVFVPFSRRSADLQKHAQLLKEKEKAAKGDHHDHHDLDPHYHFSGTGHDVHQPLKQKSNKGGSITQEASHKNSHDLLTDPAVHQAPVEINGCLCCRKPVVNPKHHLAAAGVGGILPSSNILEEESSETSNWQKVVVLQKGKEEDIQEVINMNRKRYQRVKPKTASHFSKLERLALETGVLRDHDGRVQTPKHGHAIGSKHATFGSAQRKENIQRIFSARRKRNGGIRVDHPRTIKTPNAAVLTVFQSEAAFNDFRSKYAKPIPSAKKKEHEQITADALTKVYTDRTAQFEKMYEKAHKNCQLTFKFVQSGVTLKGGRQKSRKSVATPHDNPNFLETPFAKSLLQHHTTEIDDTDGKDPDDSDDGESVAGGRRDSVASRDEAARDSVSQRGFTIDLEATHEFWDRKSSTTETSVYFATAGAVQRRKSLVATAADITTGPLLHRLSIVAPEFDDIRESAEPREQPTEIPSIHTAVSPRNLTRSRQQSITTLPPIFLNESEHLPRLTALDGSTHMRRLPKTPEMAPSPGRPSTGTIEMIPEKRALSVNESIFSHASRQNSHIRPERSISEIDDDRTSTRSGTPSIPSIWPPPRPDQDNSVIMKENEGERELYYTRSSVAGSRPHDSSVAPAAEGTEKQTPTARTVQERKPHVAKSWQALSMPALLEHQPTRLTSRQMQPVNTESSKLRPANLDKVGLGKSLLERPTRLRKRGVSGKKKLKKVETFAYPNLMRVWDSGVAVAPTLE
ncbi:hypothetical protein HDU76_007701 [Blyttiomyces sp. JEL0837]|nr:hypothetical protein HDU76_007701 [Blyttiomyces sp. JEL0837]